MGHLDGKKFQWRSVLGYKRRRIWVFAWRWSFVQFWWSKIIIKIIICASLYPILKINKKIISDSLSPWNYFHKTMVLILS